MRVAPPGRHVPVQPVLVDVRVRPARPAGLNTYQGLIIPNIASALGAFLLRQFFLGVPRELGEAARTDRAGELTVFLRIYAPLARPVTAALATILFLQNWNNFLLPLIAVNTTNMEVISQGLAVFQSQFTTRYNLTTAAALIAIIPVLAVAVTAQRHIIEGITLGALDQQPAYHRVVDIEERLLRYSPDAPLRAWRLFRVRTDGKRLVLSSPMYHDDTTGRTPLWPAAEANASCYKRHPAPAPGCRCGIYGAVAGTLDSLPGYLRDTACERDPWAYAEIACHGRVFIDMRGVRAERARLVRIALPATGWPGQAPPDEPSRMLRDRYRVPVGGAECVPQWLTANARPGGPPPDAESLGLDLARLGLSCQETLTGT